MERKKIKVSVIMLAYNIDRYVETAIRSVLCQELDEPVQLVIAEDSSTDRTLDICRGYEALYPDRITLVRHEHNVGLQQNFLDAHCRCTGEYIAICDGDDYWTDRHKLRKMVAYMDAHPDTAICFHRVINYYEGDGSKSLSNGGQQAVTGLLDLARSNYITNSSSLFRRKYYPEAPAWFARITSCDYAMHLLNAQHGSIYYFKRPMAVYRKHGKGIWSEAGADKQLTAALEVREQLLDFFQEQRLVYATLLVPYRQIAVALLRYYRKAGDDEGIAAIRMRLLHRFPDETMIKLMQLDGEVPVAAASVRWRKGVFLLLKHCRQLVSRCLPLPRIR
ncbi:MAG: glycosyltransferase [Bacteroides sp.]